MSQNLLVSLRPDGTLPARVEQRIQALAAGVTGETFVYNQETPSASWYVQHEFGRLPAVQVFVAGEQVWADIEVGEDFVSVVFPGPVTGSLVIS